MERDFLGLNWKSPAIKEVVNEDSSRQQQMLSHPAGRVIRPQPSKVSQPLLYFKATYGDEDLVPSPFGHIITQPPSIAKSAWNLPVSNNINSSISTSMSRTVVLDQEKSLQGAPVARPLSNPSSLNSSCCSVFDLCNKLPSTRTTDIQPGRQASMTMFYSGEVHFFQGIPPEDAELIMSIAGGSKPCMTSDSKRTLDLVTEENHITDLQLSTQQASPYSYKGGLAMARKATLARFLEKRMHRFSHTRPYNLNVKFLGSDNPKGSSEMMVSPEQQQEVASSTTG